MNEPVISGERLVELLTRPESVVVVGASARLDSPSGRPLAYLTKFGYEGDLTVVNPRHEKVAGLPAIPDIASMAPGAAEVAIVNLPAAAVPAAISELGERGVKAAVVIASGFEDADSEPRRELVKAIEATTMRLIGPNCVGTMSVGAAAHLTFSSVLGLEQPKPGGIALVTQSGALGNSVLLSLLRRGAGVAHWFSTGDELDTGALELIAGLLPREDVSGVGVFLEGITDIEWLDRATEAIERTGKPVFVVKAANTDLGRLAASGHTGRVVGSSDVSEAVLEQAGIRAVATVEELADVLVCLDLVPPLKSGRVGVISVSGASAVLASDKVHGSPALELADLDTTALRARIDERLELTNPIDVPFLGETPVFAETITSVAASQNVDAVVAIESGLAHDESELVRHLLRDGGPKVPTVITYLCSDDPLGTDSIRRLAESGVAVVPTPARAVAALAALAPPVDETEEEEHSQEQRDGEMLGIEAVAELPGADALPLAEWRVVDSAEAAEAALEEFGAPVVIKAAGRTLAHRSEAGAVRIGVDAESLPDDFAAVEKACGPLNDAILVQRQAEPGFEVLLAVLRDPEYGPVALLRPGGVLAELLDEQVVLSSLWSPAARKAQLTRSRLGRLLDGYRGGKKYDLDGLARTADAFLALMDSEDIQFIELNPVIVGIDGVTVVDALGHRSGGTN